MTGFVQHLLDEICTLVVEFHRKKLLKGYLSSWNRKESDLYDGIDVSGDLSASLAQVPF